MTTASLLPDRTGRLASVAQEYDLLHTDPHGRIRVPFLVRGELRVPTDIDVSRIESAFEQADSQRGVSSSSASTVHIDDQCVMRMRVIDRQDFRPTGAFRYLIMPALSPSELLERDPSELAQELYGIGFDEVLSFIRSLQEVLVNSPDFVSQVSETTLAFADIPDAWHRAAFDALSQSLDADALADAVDRELGHWGIPGREFLNGWVDTPTQVLSAPVHQLLGVALEKRTPQLRALPTRQLHITAGNSPQIPLISALRAFLTKSPATVKSPGGAVVPGALLALAASRIDHPIARHLSIVYWPGGYAPVESRLFAPDAYDRVVVWGAPESVSSVKTRALFTKVIPFNPRYSVSYIGREAFAPGASLPNIARAALADSLIANQKACIASQIHYIEGTPEQARQYAQAVQTELATFDASVPNVVAPATNGEIKRLRRGRFLNADWFANTTPDGAFASGAVVADEFPALKHPMSRMVVVRPLNDLREALGYLHAAVATVSVWPEKTRLELRDDIAARGVSNVVPLGHSGLAHPGMSHDGMIVLSELVDWKNS